MRCCRRNTTPSPKRCKSNSCRAVVLLMQLMPRRHRASQRRTVRSLPSAAPPAGAQTFPYRPTTVGGPFCARRSAPPDVVPLIEISVAPVDDRRRLMWARSLRQSRRGRRGLAPEAPPRTDSAAPTFGDPAGDLKLRIAAHALALRAPDVVFASRSGCSARAQPSRRQRRRCSKDRRWQKVR